MNRSFTVICLFSLLFCVSLSSDNNGWSGVLPVVKKEQRTVIAQTEFGQISAADVSDGIKGPYHLEFITLEPNSIFLPVLLHADMVLFVHSGSGNLTWTDEDNLRNVILQRGDIFRLKPGSAFYIQSNAETGEQKSVFQTLIPKLRIYAFFSNTEDNLFEPSIGAYSRVSDLVLGFDTRTLQSAFKIPEEILQIIKTAERPPPIVAAPPKNQTNSWEMGARFLKAFLGEDIWSSNNEMKSSSKRTYNFIDGIWSNKKKKKSSSKKAYNIFEEEPDFENCNGWSVTVDKKDLKLLQGSNVEVFAVNLTKGSMMGPHWNPEATEISIVLHGQGMIQVICPSNSELKCQNMRFWVEEGDVFAVPRFHPMAQISFNNGSFVFMGFSTSSYNYPQFLAGKNSVLQVLDRYILSLSLNVSNVTLDDFLDSEDDSLILDCTSCAEEEFKLMKEAIAKEKQEEEEARKREEEREIEEARREEAKKREEEREREEAAARKKQEEEVRREEERKREEEREREEARKRQEEEARREEAKKREEEREREEAAARKKQEEEARREEAKKREEEREREEAAARKKQEEEARREEERKREEEREREEEEEARKRQEEEARREEERKREEETKREEEVVKKRQEADARREEERKREEEEARKQEEEREREPEEGGGQPGGGQGGGQPGGGEGGVQPRGGPGGGPGGVQPEGGHGGVQPGGGQGGQPSANQDKEGSIKE